MGTVPHHDGRNGMKRTVLGAVLLAVAALALAACGGSSKKSSSGGETDKGKTEPALTKEVRAACEGSPLAATRKLPPSFPQIEADKLTYTKQSTVGPTVVLDGYFHGSVTDAHEEFQKELKGAGYAILFNDFEPPHDSEISWKGEGRTGQVAMRAECPESDRTYVHITNRPAS
jgi:hypothetical protein